MIYYIRTQSDNVSYSNHVNNRLLLLNRYLGVKKTILPLRKVCFMQNKMKIISYLDLGNASLKVNSYFDICGYSLYMRKALNN